MQIKKNKLLNLSDNTRPKVINHTDRKMLIKYLFKTSIPITSPSKSSATITSGLRCALANSRAGIND